MDGFFSLAEVLRRCKLSNGVVLCGGNRGQVQIRNNRALERLRGMIGQEKNSSVLDAMKIEMLFLKVRKVYLEKNKTKKPWLNRAVHIAREKFGGEFEEYIRCRKDLWISKSLKTEDRKTEERLNEIVTKQKQPEKQQKKTVELLKIEKTGEDKHETAFEGIDLVFYSEELLEMFKNRRYAEVLQKTRGASDSPNGKLDFEIELVRTISKIEKFRDGLEKHRGAGEKARRNLKKYVSQWSAMFQSAKELFASNFIRDEYLEKVNSEISEIQVKDARFIPLHPVTYDISSVYVQLEKSATGVAGLLKGINIFKR